MLSLPGITLDDRIWKPLPKPGGSMYLIENKHVLFTFRELEWTFNCREEGASHHRVEAYFLALIL